MSTPEPKMLQDTKKMEESSAEDVTIFYNPHVDVSDIDEAKLIRKIDWKLLPWLSLLYLLTFLDRTSIGNAKVHCQPVCSGLTLTRISNSYTVWLSTYASVTSSTCYA